MLPLHFNAQLPSWPPPPSPKVELPRSLPQHALVAPASASALTRHVKPGLAWWDFETLLRITAHLLSQNRIHHLQVDRKILSIFGGSLMAHEISPIVEAMPWKLSLNCSSQQQLKPGRGSHLLILSKPISRDGTNDVCRVHCSNRQLLDCGFSTAAAATCICLFDGAF
ncbi:uncharacterized protein QC764_0106140 [Podospora pseudoanserina]|uniref:Uncharacterized protein n=1 Tax=Podospora pseudoanserina TaxID=2609844 RepID=A0ABR0HLN1_9PEZI|nr:hypothetical protein QC764_0106140 [Podospora pseudoanserina]